MHDFGFRKVTPAKQLLIQQVGFVNLRHFFQHQRHAKNWFKNLKILAKIFTYSPWFQPKQYVYQEQYKWNNLSYTLTLKVIVELEAELRERTWYSAQVVDDADDETDFIMRFV